MAVFLTSHTSKIYTHLRCITACHLCKLRSVHGIALFSEFQSLHNTINYSNLPPRTKQPGEQIRKLVKERSPVCNAELCFCSGCSRFYDLTSPAIVALKNPPMGE
ncbi:hypothetical protein [Nostoc sp.]|uniref:hypothetical protein n=1 Tax=Nostoc sp. TaxID=1180 RepID=UPI002FF4B1C5